MRIKLILLMWLQTITWVRLWLMYQSRLCVLFFFFFNGILLSHACPSVSSLYNVRCKWAPKESLLDHPHVGRVVVLGEGGGFRGSSQGVRAVTTGADEGQIASRAAAFVLLQQSRDLLVVRVGVERLVVLVVVVVVRALLHFLRLRVMLFLGRGHLGRVPLPPLGPPVLEPHLGTDTRRLQCSTGPLQKHT